MLSAGRVVVGEDGSETLVPSIVLSHGGGEISTVTIQDRLEILGSDADIRHGVKTVASIGGTFLRSDLHHPDFACATGDTGVAGGFLECDGGEEDGRDAGFGSHGLEHGEVRRAGSKGVAIPLEHGCEVRVHEVFERNRGWDPSATVYAAVEPV